MAKFNLGKIKGEKGESGEAGIKGDRGDSGAKGDTGSTPVLTVGEVSTLEYDENARVEIDSSDPDNPVIDFFIPKGKDGQDALGDMAAAIYDTTGKESDVYEYADSLVQQCLKLSGGNLGGNVKAHPGNASLQGIKNIYISDTLLQNAAVGDICILENKKTSMKLSDAQIGSTVLIGESGEDKEYIIADKDFHAQDTVTLIRKNVITGAISMNYSGSAQYNASNPDIVLETVFKECLDENTKEYIAAQNVNTVLKRHIFLPSSSELENLEYFSDHSIGAKDESGQNRQYWTRTSAQNIAHMLAVSTGASIYSLPPGNLAYMRPMLVLSKDTPIENSSSDFAPAYKIPENSRGIFVFENGDWRRCMP